MRLLSMQFFFHSTIDCSTDRWNIALQLPSVSLFLSFCRSFSLTLRYPPVACCMRCDALTPLVTNSFPEFETLDSLTSGADLLHGQHVTSGSRFLSSYVTVFGFWSLELTHSALTGLAADRIRIAAVVDVIRQRQILIPWNSTYLHHNPPNKLTDR